MVLLVLLTMGVSSALAQRRGFGGYGGRNRREAIQPNPPYDDRFSFVRLRYGPDYGFVAQSIPWSHDYPTGEQHFMKILNELSYLNPHVDETSILPLDSPDLCKYPVAYMAEPGFLTLSEWRYRFSSYSPRGTMAR